MVAGKLYRTNPAKPAHSARLALNSGIAMVRRMKKLNRRQKNEVKRLINNNVEPKFLDTITAYAQIDRTAQITQLTAIPQGNTQGKRIADEAMIKYVECRFDAYLNGTLAAYDAAHSFRFILFRWNIDTSIAAPSLGSIITGAGTVNDMNAGYDWNAWRQHDFTVLFDKVYAVDDYKQVCQSFKISVNKRVTFDPAATSGEGHLYALFLGNDASGAHTPNLQLQSIFRVVFTDE